MPSLVSTQRDQALTLLKRRGIARLVELQTAGVTATTVSRMERAGEAIRLARGLYQLPDAALDPHRRWRRLRASCPRASSVSRPRWPSTD